MKMAEFLLKCVQYIYKQNLTNSTQNSLSLETDSYFTKQEIPNFIQNLKIHYCVQRANH
jgi:hypothetical protein